MGRSDTIGCYTAPAIAAIVQFVLRRQNPKWKMSQEYRRLNPLFGCAANFCVVDHAWNNELLAFSVSDVLLDVVITATILAVRGCAAPSPEMQDGGQAGLLNTYGDRGGVQTTSLRRVSDGGARGRARARA